MPFSKTQILIVDDNPTDRLIVCAVTKKMKFAAIHEAEDGAVAEGKLMTALEVGQPYGLIILDWNMPRTGGMKLLQVIRQNPKLKPMKVIVMTGTSNREIVSEAILAGTNDFIVKPVDPKMLQKKIRLVMGIEA